MPSIRTYKRVQSSLAVDHHMKAREVKSSQRFLSSRQLATSLSQGRMLCHPQMFRGGDLCPVQQTWHCQDAQVQNLQETSQKYEVEEAILHCTKVSEVQVIQLCQLRRNSLVQDISSNL